MIFTGIAFLLMTLAAATAARADNLDNIINDTINSITQALNQNQGRDDDYQDNEDGQWREALSDDERRLDDGG